MSIRLNAEVLDKARAAHGFTSDEQLAVHIGMSGAALRNLRNGRSAPSVATLVKLRTLTGQPLDSMVIV
jgi:hypothetical protein